MASAPGGPPVFFSPWEPAPAFAVPPSDGELAERIRLLVNYAVKNGPSFIEMMRQKQSGDPKFSFLSGGEGGDFFRWSLYTGVYQLPGDRPLPPGIGVLDSLTASKESIKSSAAWFMAHVAHGAGLAALAAHRAVGCGERERQLHLIYLANDPVIGAMLAAAFNTAGRGEDTRARLDKILRFWGDKHVYDSDTMGMIEDAAFNTDDPATLLPPLPAPFVGMPMGGPPPGYMTQQQPGMPQAAAPTPMSAVRFGEGVGAAVHLVKEKNKCEVPYTPMDQADIERAGLPAMPEKDSHLLARLDRFYADLREYRPGLSRADLEDDIRGGKLRSRSEEPEDGEGGGRRRRERYTGPLNDGSFAGGQNVSKYAGLGATTAEEPSQQGGGASLEDMYSQYRQVRSGSYHDMIFKSTAAAGGGRR
eukprot:XP_001692188.1 predicted protein [Chlamydomonas reinhardtii]